MIKKLRELEAKATKGTWVRRDPLPGGYRTRMGIAGDVLTVAEVLDSLDEFESNADLIAEMRNALPALLRVAEAAPEAARCLAYAAVSVHRDEQCSGPLAECILADCIEARLAGEALAAALKELGE